MFTQNKSPKREGFSVNYSEVNRLLDQLQAKLASTRPPRLRLAQANERCVACKQFIYSAGRAHSGDGECTEYRTFVRADFVCDSYVSEDEEWFLQALFLYL